MISHGGGAGLRLAIAALMCAALGAGCAPASETASSAAAPQTGGPARAPAIAAASDVAQIKAPSLHEGDVWIDQIRGADREFRIETVHPDGTMDVNFWGTEMTTDSNLNIIVYRSLTEASSEPSTSDKPGLWFAYPLYPGKSWENRYNWQMAGASRITGRADERGQAFDWEQVTVPAGTFRALKAQVTSRFFGRGGMADEATLIYWYAPQVNRFVKFDYRSNFEGAFVAELVKYQPAPAAR
jgi:hypothetical protein